MNWGEKMVHPGKTRNCYANHMVPNKVLPRGLLAIATSFYITRITKNKSFNMSK